MKQIFISASALFCAVGCAMNDAGHVDQSFLNKNMLEYHELSAVAQQEYLEVDLNPADSQLRLKEIAKIKGFLDLYTDKGHGPLILSIPNSGETEALAIRAAVETREMAWQRGIDYQEIQGMAYDASSVDRAPMVLAFTSYTTAELDCPFLGQVNFTNAESNSDLPTLGCAVRTNMAAMIADPADILGTRPLDEGDIDRRATQLEAFREGGATGAERGDQESAQISGAIQ